jgi:hypothetical protein
MDSKNPQVREEALKTLYRLRAQLDEREDGSTARLKAVDSLIEEYEEQISNDRSPSV